MGLTLTSVSPVLPLMFIGDPSGKFVSGLTLKSSHSVLHGNTWLCLLSSQSSAAGKTAFWMYI
jgi:hypothetical protein